MGNVARVGDVHQAIALAARLRSSGKYDWFRGQVKNYPLVPSYIRLPEPEKDEALEKFGRFEHWVRTTPGLEELAAAGTDHMLAVAQHYGLPTPFLDFTTDPEIAGFFACDSDELVPGQPSCIICLNTRDLADFWRDMPAEWRPPELLRIDVSNLWRLQAQRGVFLFCPYENIEKIYDFDRIIFPAGVKPSREARDRIYPVRKSQLEILLDQYFMNERLIEGSRHISGQWTVVHIDPPPGRINPDLVEKEIPPLASWRPEVLAAWRSTYDERLAGVQRGTRRQLAIDLSAAPATIAEQVAAQVTVMASRGGTPRDSLIDWRCEAGRGTAGGAMAAELETALDWLWDGVRSLPCTDQDLAIGIGNCVGVAAAHWKVSPLNPEPWQDAADAVFGPAVEVGFDGTDGSYSKGYAAASSLLKCVREDITQFVRSEFRNEILGNIVGMLQAVQAPDRLFEFECLAQLFARQLAPTQVLTRAGSAVFFSPARIISLGLP